MNFFDADSEFVEVIVENDRVDGSRLPQGKGKLLLRVVEKSPRDANRTMTFGAQIQLGAIQAINLGTTLIAMAGQEGVLPPELLKHRKG